MSNKPKLKNDSFKITDQKDKLGLILNIKSSNLSERAKPVSRTVDIRQISSEVQIESNVNYDDLCGSWIYKKNPVYDRYIKSPIPKLCVWKCFTEQDLDYLKKYQKNKEVVLSFFENKFSNECKDKNIEILVNVLWEFFKFMRFHSFTEKSISAALELVYMIHSFFLSRPWWTAQEVYQFFHEAVLLHVVLNPPKSLEIFTINEARLLFKAFHEICMENLILLYILYHPSCHLFLEL